MTTPPPGWYDDGRGERRWWDGAAWTGHVATPPADRTVAQPTAPTVPLRAEDQAGPAPVPPYTPPESRPPDALPQYGPQTLTPERPRSMMWGVWVGLGVVVLGVIVALAFLTPALLNGFTAGVSPAATPSNAASGAPSSAPSSAPPTTDSSEDPVAGGPSDADRQAAVDAVNRHNASWLTGDCDAYLATTTEQFRSAVMLVPDCESFDTESRLFAGQVDGYETTIGDVEVVGSAVVVSTTETYTSGYDVDGNPTDEPVAYEDRYEYILVSENGRWVIDDFFAE